MVRCACRSAAGAGNPAARHWSKKIVIKMAVLSSRTRQTASPDGGIISRRQQSGALDVYNVQNDGSILNQIETEGFEGAATEMSGDSTGAAQPGAGTSAPAPAGN